MTLEIRELPISDLETTEERVLALLDAHAEGIGLPFIMEKLAFEAWEGETFLGGLTAKIVQEWMFVSLLAVSPEARGRGIGGQLMARAETEAANRNLTGIWLDTFSFQAPGFYESLGFEKIGTLPDSPKGESRYFYRKRLKA